MDKVLKRVTHKKQSSSSSTSKPSEKCSGGSSRSSSSPNKRYSVDDNFYMYSNKNDLYQNCGGGTSASYYTMSNRKDLKTARNTIHRSSRAEAAGSCAEGERDKQLMAREDVTFKRLLRMFHAGENGRGAKEWFASNASNVMELAPKILSKRFCGKKGGENELYRSNSFKFERFERADSDTLTMSKKSPVSRQISLCDDYSLPVDFVNKRPLSLDSGSFWSAQSPNTDQVEVLNLYCDPKDSKNPQNSGEAVPEKIEAVDDRAKLYSVVQKVQHQPLAESSDDYEHEDDDADLYENLRHRRAEIRASASQHSGATYTEVRRSPYYYGDLLKRSRSENPPADGRRYEAAGYRKSRSLDTAAASATGVRREPIYSNDLKYLEQGCYSFHIEEEEEIEEIAGCPQLDEDEMATRQRHMYETAFDSKICQQANGDLVELDAVANHLLERCSPQLPYNPAFCGSMPKDRAASLKFAGRQLESSVDSLAQQFADFELTERSALLHGYSSASTSTIPLPHSVSSHLNDSVESFSESSHKSCRVPAPKFFRLEIAQKRAKDAKNGDYVNTKIGNSTGNENKDDDDEEEDRGRGASSHVKRRYPHPHHHKSPKICSGECRPKSCHLPAKILEIKSRPKEAGGTRRFSSTESMTASSSGSLESIRSSTSEGNRSTTSTDSHRSSSISSHSSDSAVGSGGHFLNFAPGNRYLNQGKMHVLSPISDKSFQEVCSEGSEVGRGAASPPHEEADGHKPKKRQPLAKNLAVADTESHQCSDSGISMESRSDTSKVAPSSDLCDLPFDMPKLRRRRLQQMQLTQGSTQDTSSSATSVDLKELPFDMPKLRRKLRTPSNQDSSEVPAESGSAVAEGEPIAGVVLGNGNEKTSNGLEQGRNRKSLGLSLNLNDIVPAGINIDTNLPLERQGWYHGAITRMEAENELRNREEGSYLVRNSESAKHDYSLSLKSAKGFMHMRIQKSGDSDKFILGQFSSPFDTIPQMIKHYSSNQLPIRGAEHMCLLQPVIVQLL